MSTPGFTSVGMSRRGLQTNALLVAGSQYSQVGRSFYIVRFWLNSQLQIILNLEIVHSNINVDFTQISFYLL